MDSNSLHMQPKHGENVKENVQFILEHSVGIIQIYLERLPLCKQCSSNIQETLRQLVPRENLPSSEE